LRKRLAQPAAVAEVREDVDPARLIHGELPHQGGRTRFAERAADRPGKARQALPNESQPTTSANSSRSLSTTRQLFPAAWLGGAEAEVFGRPDHQAASIGQRGQSGFDLGKERSAGEYLARKHVHRPP